MNTLLLGVVVVLLAVIAAGGFIWFRREQERRRPKQPRGGGMALDALDTVTAWEPQATRIMTSAERLAYATLLRALPDHLILSQVPLSRFLRVPTRYSYAEWLARVGQLCGDLVVCDASSQVLAVVEVRSSTQSDRGRRRQDRMDRVLKAAGVPLHVWSDQALPSVTSAREMVLREASAPETEKAVKRGKAVQPPSAAPTTAPTGAPTTAPIPLSQLAPPAPPAPPRPSSAILAAHGLAGGLKDNLGVPVVDDGAEMRDPPPSTWFDDLDVTPAPGKKLPTRH